MKSPAARAWLQAAALSLLACVFFAPGLVLGELPVFRDLLVLVLPLRHYTAEALWRGEIPLWSPEIFFGAPYLANYQSAVLYPPSLLAGLGTIPFGLSLYLAFHVAIAGVGTSRYLERVAGLPPLAAIFGGIVFAFGGFLFSLVSLTNQLAAAAWLPWVLLAAERLWSAPRAAAFVALALLASLQLLAGAPEVVILTGALVAASAMRGLWRGEASIRALVPVGAAFTFAVAIAAAQLLPTFEYLGQTNRADGLPYAEVAAESFEPASLLQFLLPHTFEGGAPGFMPEPGVPLFWSLYLGAAPLILVGAALASRPPLFWVATAVLATLLSMGSHFVLFPALHAIAPGIVGAFRYPGKLFLPAHLALAVLAAAGLARTLESSRARTAAMIAAGIVTAFGIAILLFNHSDPERALRTLGYDLRAGLSAETYAAIAGQVSAKARRLIAFALATGGLVWFFVRAAIRQPVFLGLLLLSSFLDLVTVHQPSLAFTDPGSLRGDGAGQTPVTGAGQRVFHYVREPDGTLAPWVGRIRIAEPVEKRARSLWRARIPNLAVLDHATVVGGVDGFAPHDRADFFRTLASLGAGESMRLLAALGTERVIGEEPLEEPGLESVLDSADLPLRVYDLSERAPRTYLARRTWLAPDRLHALRQMALPEFRPGRDAVLTETSDSPRALGGGTIDSVSFARERIQAQVTLAAPGLWVVADSWFPGWEATLDGTPVEILRVNGIHRGIRVPEGSHTLEMRYRPASFRIGGRISMLALILLVPAAFVAGSGGRKPRGRPA